MAAAAEAVKEKAPEVSEQLGEAARRAGTVISSAVHRDAGHESTTAATQGNSHGAQHTARNLVVRRIDSTPTPR